MHLEVPHLGELLALVLLVLLVLLVFVVLPALRFVQSLVELALWIVPVELREAYS
jgi:hypothetical protein